MVRRNIAKRVLQALSDNPVVLLNGARQSGKSTLAKQLISDAHPARYLTLDDATTLEAAKSDPSGFISGLNEPVVIDEVQRAPELFLAIKAEVDRKRQPGRFLLTGSADVFLLPSLSESLAGRMEVLTLWPFSQGEIDGIQEGFIDALFDNQPLAFSEPSSRADIFSRAISGGFPEVIQRESGERRRAWFGSYVTTILQRDVRDLANIEGLTALPRLLALLATRATATLNLAELSRGTGVAQTTLRRYLTLLEATFLIHNLLPWFSNIGKRLVKSPKLLMSDTGLLAYESGITLERLQHEPGLAGSLLENFVAMELHKQASWSLTQPRLFHFRTQRGQEVDIVMEDAAGSIVGVEVKTSATVKGDDFTGLRVLAEALGPRFRRGLVLYTGSETVPYGGQMFAMPMSAIWRMLS